MLNNIRRRFQVDVKVPETLCSSPQESPVLASVTPEDLVNTIKTQVKVGTDGKLCVSSRDVAETFARRHGDVLDGIRALECSADFTERNFSLSDYRDTTGRTLPQYLITRDGFVFLAMGFTGARAAEFKEAYINAFNYYEHQTKAKKTPTDSMSVLRMMFAAMDEQQQRTNDQLLTVTAAVDAVAKVSTDEGLPTMTSDEQQSLLPCLRKTKTQKCDCRSCSARCRFWGRNFNITQQERLRMGETLDLIEDGLWDMRRTINHRNLS